MSIPFSDTSGNTGILQQSRFLVGADANQWPTIRVVNSSNNWLDFLTGYAIGADRRFQWDDTNHTKLPEGTTNLVANQSDYGFLTDEQGNNIVTLTRVEILGADGLYKQLALIDQMEIQGALEEYKKTAGTPEKYDKIADNIVRLYPKPSASISAGLKFYFQRTPSYFVSTDTTKAPGVSPLLHRGFIIASAYDAALTLGLPNLQWLSKERDKEEQKAMTYFADRNQDSTKRFIPRELTMGDSNR